MTELLFYRNAYLSRFEAVVLDVAVYRGRPALILDRTAFFPEGGGQPGDAGRIGCAEVCDTQIEDGTVYHIVKNAVGFNTGDTVHCEIDFDARFARMQAHTGEHIVSGIAHTLYGANNVGFHMDGTVMTVDFDLPLSGEQLSVLERKANECVYKNVDVRCWFPSNEELAGLVYRSKSEHLQNVRIVTVEVYDQCACCAVHVARTGEIGVIKILSAVSHRGGVRLTLNCGITAYTDYCRKHEQTMRIADILAARHYETDTAVEKLLQKEKDLRWQLAKKTENLIGYVKDGAKYCEGNRVFAFPDFSPEELKKAATVLQEVCGGLCCVISGDDCKGYYFAMASSAVNVKDFTKAVTMELNGSGGGRFDVVQGRFNADRERIEAYFAGLKVN